MYTDRDYRKACYSGLTSFTLAVKETDLAVSMALPPERGDEAREALYRHIFQLRETLEDFLRATPLFAKTLRPYLLCGNEPAIAQKMAVAGNACGVGPMAAVAGAFSAAALDFLSAYSEEIIVENGGDIAMHSQKPRVVGVFAGNSPFSGRLGVRVAPGSWGICTSSGTVGPSLSFGKADAVAVLSPSALLADAAATAGANRVVCEDDLPAALDFLRNTGGVMGALLIKNEKMLLWGGDWEIVPLESEVEQ